MEYNGIKMGIPSYEIFQQNQVVFYWIFQLIHVDIPTYYIN